MEKIEVIAKLGLKKDVGYLYFITKTGDVARVKASRKGRPKN